MGDNFLRQQVKNFKRGRDLAMQESECPTLFERPDVLKTVFTATPCNSKPFAVGESLYAVATKASQQVAVLRGYERIGVIDGDSAKALLEALSDPTSLGVTSVRVVDVGELSGVAKVEIQKDGRPK